MLRVVLINVLLLFGILAAAEAALWVLVHRDQRTAIGAANGFATRLYWRSTGLIQFDPDCARYDPELFYTLRPGTCSFGTTAFSTSVGVNEAGLRDDAASLVAPRVIVTGDSQAMGWGVGDDQTFAALIEAETGLRTLNAAVSSYGTAREVGMVNRQDRSALDVLIVQFSNNDVLENRTYLEGGRTLSAGSEERYLEEVGRTPRGGYVPFLYLGRFAALIAERFGGDRGPSPDRATLPGENEVDQFLDILSDVDLGDRRPRLIVLELSLYGGYRPFVRKLEESGRIAALGEKYASVSVLDTQEILSRDDYLFPDGHVNAAGHRKLAERIIAILGAPPPGSAAAE